MVLIALPILLSIILMVFLTSALNYLLQKLKFKVTFLFSFSIAYLFVSSVLIVFQNRNPPSEFYDRLLVMGPLIFSFPAGIIPILFKSNFFINYYRTTFILIFGIIQWLLISFLERKLGQNNKTFRIILWVLSIILILFTLLVLGFAILFGKDLE